MRCSKLTAKTYKNASYSYKVIERCGTPHLSHVLISHYRMKFSWVPYKRPPPAYFFSKKFPSLLLILGAPAY